MKIHLNEMIFYGFHGVHPEERKLGQRFTVNAVVSTDDNKDAMINHLDDTVDYTKVYSEIKHIMENKQFHLLENCANEIIKKILDKFQDIQEVNIKIKKPSVPINGSLSSVEVEMTRLR